MATTSADALSDWQARRVPRLRIAASPYPNWLLHILPTDVDLGKHRYRVWIPTLGVLPSSETSRGHLYTRHAGFVDLAHIRRSIDFTAYLHHEIRDGLTRRASHFSFESIDRTTYHCQLSYPDFWDDLEADQRARLIEEIAIEAADHASFDFSNWREIITWYGFHNVPGFPEKGSAFSYEDVTSHCIGALVAERALRTPGVPFDQAAAIELDREMTALHIVSKEDYLRAMALVKDKWWGEKTCLKRNIDVGCDDGQIETWLVRGLEPGIEPRPKIYPVPGRDFTDIEGYDCTGMVVFECEPRMRERKEVMKLLGPEVTRIRPDRDYPVIIARIEEEIKEEFGPHATVPYP